MSTYHLPAMTYQDLLVNLYTNDTGDPCLLETYKHSLYISTPPWIPPHKLPGMRLHPPTWSWGVQSIPHLWKGVPLRGLSLGHMNRQWTTDILPPCAHACCLLHACRQFAVSIFKCIFIPLTVFFTLLIDHFMNRNKFINKRGNGNGNYLLLYPHIHFILSAGD